MFFMKPKKSQPSFNLETLRQSRVPILTLDKGWHNMFPIEKKTKNILQSEERLNKLIKEQGKLTNEYKEYVQIKKQYMDQILALTTEAFDNQSESAKDGMSKAQKYILDINNRLENIEKRLRELPEEIQIANSILLEESVKVCYGEMKESQVALQDLNQWIEETRTILKVKLEQKGIHEERVQGIYAYLHNLVGSDFIEYLDKNYWR